jgi:Carboxypeptidase regulatory-like domain
MRQLLARSATYVLLLAVLGLGFSGVTAYAQANSEITGIVADQTGAIIPGAHLTLTNVSTGSTVTTDANGTGLFEFPALNVGTYNLKATAKGFVTYVSKGLVLNVSQVLRADVKMQIGAATTTVTVEADALQVQTDENVISTTIDSQQVEKIATENRNFAALAAMGLGVSSELPASNTPTSVAANFTLSINGLRQSHNIWLIDGGEADDRGGAGGMDIMPSQDAIAQFQVLSSNYPPDYGISSGATISLALKSGGEHYHGEAWEFNRNTDYDANNYFNKLTNPVQPRTPLHYNIFGANVGGPLLPMFQHPRKTFFFWNEEWRRIIQSGGVLNNATLDANDFPTAGQDLHYVSPAFKATTLVVPTIGDPAFNAKLAADGLTPGGSFPGNVIPANLFDPNAVIYLNSGIVPHPNTSNDYFIEGVSLPIYVRDDIARVDHNINDKWKIFGHYMHDSVTQGYGAPELGWTSYSYPTVTSTLSNPSNSAAIKLSGSISPSLLVEASFNYDGNIINITDQGGELASGFDPNRFFQTTNPNMPGITSFGAPYNTSEDTASAPWHNAAEDFEPRLDVSYTRGKHAMKLGFSYNRYTKNQQLFGDAQGAYSFGNLSGDGFMDMLMGLASSFSQYQATPIRHYVNQTTSAWVEDNWHVSPRLSLQIGLRYDALPHAWERNNAVANFNPEAYQAGAEPEWNSDGSMNSAGPGFYTPAGMTVPFYLNGMELAGQYGFPKGLVTNRYGTLQPRIGFSEDIFGDGKTVLRGGFGTFFERMQGNDIYNAATNPPFAYNPKATNVYFSDPHTSWQTGETALTPVFASGLTNLALNYPPPAVAQFSFGVQHQLAPSMIWVVQYVGNLAWHQNIEEQINNFPLDTPMSIRADAGDPSNKSGTNPGGANLANSEIYRTYQGYDSINEETNNTNGSYNGFQTGLRLQNKHGLSGELDYTYSHEIDITSYDLDGVSNPWNLKYDKGSGALDRRQILSANYIYNLPVYAHGNGLTHSLLGGWELAGTAVFQTGTIVSNQGLGLNVGYDTIGLDGGYTNRPDQVAPIHYTKKGLQWFDPSSFAAPNPAWAGGLNQGFGDTRKDSVVGPGNVNFDTSLYKSFAVTEGSHVELRFESFNTFNHTQFNSVDSKLGDGNFGQVTGTMDPRTLELGAKFVF